MKPILLAIVCLCFAVQVKARHDSIEIVHKMLIGTWVDQNNPNNEAIVTSDSIKQFYKWNCKGCIKLQGAYAYKILHKSCTDEDTVSKGWYLYVYGPGEGENYCDMLKLPLEQFSLLWVNEPLSGIYIQKYKKRKEFKIRKGDDSATMAHMLHGTWRNIENPKRTMVLTDSVYNGTSRICSMHGIHNSIDSATSWRGYYNIQHRNYKFVSPGDTTGTEFTLETIIGPPAGTPVRSNHRILSIGNEKLYILMPTGHIVAYKKEN